MRALNGQSFVLSVLVMGGLAAVSTAWAEDIRPHFEKDDEDYYIRRVDTREVRRIGEADVETHNTAEAGLKFKVADAKSDGSTVLECTVLFVERTEVIGDQSTTFDSRKGGVGGNKAPWTRKIRDYLNKPFKLTLDKNGAVTKVDGLPSTGKTLYNPFEELFSESAFQRLPLFATAGAAPSAKSGDVWTQKFDHPVAMSNSRIVEALEFKVDKLGDKADISFKGKYTTAARELQSDESGKVSTVKDLQGAREGKLVWNVEDGRCEEFRSQAKVQWSEAMPGAENMPIKVERTSTDALKTAKLEDFKLRTLPAAAKPAKPKDSHKEEGHDNKDGAEDEVKAKGDDTGEDVEEDNDEGSDSDRNPE